jgi:hypothetical protein
VSNQIIVLRKALQQSKPFSYLRCIVEKLLHDGYDKEVILAEFESFRKLSKDDSYEDVVLDVMDCLTGWCSPQMRIEHPKELESNLKVQPITPSPEHQQRTTSNDLHRVINDLHRVMKRVRIEYPKELESNLKVQPITPSPEHQQRTTYYRVMKRAWELARQTEVQRGWGHAYEYIMGGCLNMAWQEEKNMNAT